MLMATQKEATLRLYDALNSPTQAGRVWVKYEREVILAALDVLKQIMRAQGYEFRPGVLKVPKQPNNQVERQP
jgi:hypothetical protein